MQGEPLKADTAQAPELGMRRGHTSDQAQAVAAVTPAPDCWDLAKAPCWDSGPIDADQPRRQEVTELGSQRPPEWALTRSPPPTVAWGPWG